MMRNIIFAGVAVVAIVLSGCGGGGGGGGNTNNTTDGWTKLGTGCCNASTGYLPEAKLSDGELSPASKCRSSCPGDVVTFDAGWCTCWNSSMMNSSSCVPLKTDKGNCGNDFSGASTWYKNVTTTTTTHSTTTSITTTTTPPKRKDSPTPPLSVDAVLTKLNRNFQGYDNANLASAKGVTISWIKNEDEKVKLYCPEVAGNDWDGCYEGAASCRMSTMIHNKVLPVVNGNFMTFSKRKAGVVFNQELVDNYFGKCSFIYDGGANDRYNYGCGNGASVDFVNCNSTYSPMNDICPSTNKTCTAADPEVNAVECDKFGGHADATNRNCFYKGRAYDIRPKDINTHYSGVPMWETNDELRTMVDDRFTVQKSYNCGDQCWNEIILDERLLLTQLWWDPATAVDAFVFFRGDAGSLAHAKKIQQQFQADWGVTPPLIAVDTGCNIGDAAACAPFYAPNSEMVA